MEVGDVLGHRYELRERLGTGSTATVWRADDRELGRPVALKLFGPASAVSDPARRRREARALAALRHPSIVAIFDARLDDDPPYLVLEYVPGPTLADELVRGPLDADRSRAVIAAAAAGLVPAHAAGIVHRDLKPANILLPGEGPSPARLLDFGIAHSLGAAHRTEAGTVLGSACYLSPEQARGHEVGPASDVYSLGLVWIECLTGRPAFPGSTPESIAARLVRAPDLDAPELAPEASLLARMTATDPAERPGAEEVAALLATPAPTRLLAPVAAGVATVDLPATAPLTAGSPATERPDAESRNAATPLPEPPTPGPAAEPGPHAGRRARLAIAAALALLAVVAAAAALPALTAGPEPLAARAKVAAPVEPEPADPAPVDHGPADPAGPGSDEQGPPDHAGPPDHVGPPDDAGPPDRGGPRGSDD